MQTMQQDKPTAPNQNHMDVFMGYDDPEEALQEDGPEETMHEGSTPNLASRNTSTSKLIGLQ